MTRWRGRKECMALWGLMHIRERTWWRSTHVRIVSSLQECGSNCSHVHILMGMNWRRVIWWVWFGNMIGLTCAWRYYWWILICICRWIWGGSVHCRLDGTLLYLDFDDYHSFIELQHGTIYFKFKTNCFLYIPNLNNIIKFSSFFCHSFNTVHLLLNDYFLCNIIFYGIYVPYWSLEVAPMNWTKLNTDICSNVIERETTSYIKTISERKERSNDHTRKCRGT